MKGNKAFVILCVVVAVVLVFAGYISGTSQKYLPSKSIESLTATPTITTTTKTKTLLKPESVINKQTWRSYTNKNEHVSLKYPSNWSLSDNKPGDNGAYVVTLSGKEGAVKISWTNSGYGGGCPLGYETIQLANSQTDTCHSITSDNKESWGQITSKLGLNNGITYVDAEANASYTANRNTILNILYSLNFI